MANKVDTTVLVASKRSLVVQIAIVGDGSGDLARVPLGLVRQGAPTLVRVSGQLGFEAQLDADRQIVVRLPISDRIDLSWRRTGGIAARSDLFLSTHGLKAGDRGLLTLEARIAD